MRSIGPDKGLLNPNECNALREEKKRICVTDLLALREPALLLQ